MKKLIAIMLAAAMLFSFAACGETKKKNDNNMAPKVDPEDPTAKLTLTLDEWPVIDGALAMIPYYEEMAARILGIPVEEAREHVLSNNTPQAFKNLAEGSVDLIFCAPPSDEQIQYAKANGVEFESVQVLNSGFVFFVNKSNPVSNLSSQQLHDIYAGKITNWKEVGGNDEPIIAYQRADGSGSQTGLYEHVIPQNEVMDPPLTQRIGAMSEIIDAVANYDNAKGALGFSYYYYVTNMHYQEDVKLIAIDNIYPAPETITSDMYPYISKTCAIFNSNEPEDSAVRKIAAWCHGSAGVAMSAELGYIPSGEEYIVPGYGNKVKTHELVGMVRGNALKVDTVYVDPNEYGYSSLSYPVISGLKDAAIEKKINDVLYECFDSNINSGAMLPPEFEEYDAANYYCYPNICANYSNILSIEMYFSSTCYSETDTYYSSKSVPFNFDLRTGEQFAITDLFKDAENGRTFLDNAVYEKINDGNYMEDTENWWDYSGFVLSAPFKGLKDTQKFLLRDNGEIYLVLDEDTPEFRLDRDTAYIAIDGRSIIDFDKFESSGSLFTDDRESVHLFKSEYKGFGTALDISDYISGLPFDGPDIFPYLDAAIYDEMSEAQKTAMFAHKAEIRKVAEEYSELAGKMKKQDKFYGQFIVHVEPVRYDRFTNITEYCSGDANYMKNGEWINNFIGFTANTVFEDGNDTPLTLEGIFKDGLDYKSVIEEAIICQLRENLTQEKNLEIPGDDLLRALAHDAADNIAYFGVDSDKLLFYYDDSNAIVDRNLGGLIDRSDYWIFTSSMGNVGYRYLDCRNINIFMIK